MFIPLPSVSQLFAALVAAWITMLKIEWLQEHEKGLEKNEQQNAFLVCFEHKDQLAVCQNLVPLVNIKIAGKWMFIPLKMVLIGIDPYPTIFTHQWKQNMWIQLPQSSDPEKKTQIFLGSTPAAHWVRSYHINIYSKAPKKIERYTIPTKIVEHVGNVLFYFSKNVFIYGWINYG